MGASVLVIGSGGREHALAYGLSSSGKVEAVFVSPGSAGTALLDKTENVDLLDHDTIVDWATENGIDLVVIGPEIPLVEGLSDKLRAAGIITFGASQAAAQLEGSKSFATAFMQRHDISIPESIITRTESEALEAIAHLGGPEESVIKADGLAGGKGVFLPDNETEAITAVSKVVNGSVDGDGSVMVIQRRNHGPEVSVFVLSDGESHTVIPLASQDHKRLLAGDKGPNTGGMGVYAPLPEWMLGKDQWAKINDIAKKSITNMAEEGTPFQGVLYIGIMLSEELQGDPVVIEYNVRFGDPEAEVIIPLLMKNNVDIYEMLSATASGTLEDFPMPRALEGAALTICLAAEGYPESPIKGEVIRGIDARYPDVFVFHGGTKSSDGEIITNGGRVLYVTGFGETLEAASKAANTAIGTGKIEFKNMQYRTDIAHRAFKA